MFRYRFQFLLDRIIRLIRETELEHSRNAIQIHQTFEVIREQTKSREKSLDSLRVLSLEFVDTVTSTDRIPDNLLIHKIRCTGILKHLDRVRREQIQTVSFLKDLERQRDLLNARLVSLYQKKRQFECNRAEQESHYTLDEQKRFEQLVEDAGQMIWHRQRRERHDRDQE